MPMLSGFCAIPESLPSCFLFTPAMGVAYLDHGADHRVPRLLPLHHGIGEHAAVPADVPHLPGQVALFVAQPVAGMLGDIELAVGIGDLAVPAGLLMVARPEDGSVILRDVKIEGPWPQRVRHLAIGG